MEKFVCVHGHFYQPPRENPWLESIELQDSAAPWHDWNERIAIECYGPNAAARALNGEGKVVDITNNYTRMSFNFGPTLLAWIQEQKPDLHEAIVSADRSSRERFSGHGSALAQAYNHMILPLANARDKFTQIHWGIRDFQFRFGRLPEGMWLPETAADTETLEALAAQGIRFTILSPHQAKAVRKIGDSEWTDVSGGVVDPRRPYLVKLPSGRELALYFYHGPLAQAIAFEQLLESGDRLAARVIGAFNESSGEPQLVHIATDGESYGHHHRHGEMALSCALAKIEKERLATLTNYGEFLEKHPPRFEAQIHEKTSWSCAHGIERWKAACGCNTGGKPEWNQLWRAPLREALDWLRDETIPRFEKKAGELARDPWMARNDYIAVILDRTVESRDKFFAEHEKVKLDGAARITALRLMELQRHAMLMYTSCGWFFDELSGIETVQVIQYAARVIQLAREIFGDDLEPGFLDRIGQARGNLPEHGDGRAIYEKFVKPAMIDWSKAIGHHAISSLFRETPGQVRSFSFSFQDLSRHFAAAGKTKLACGEMRVTSEITQESADRSYAILYLGEHNLVGGVGAFSAPEKRQTMVREIDAAYQAADFPQVIRLIDQHFGQSSFSLRSLFKDEQRRILNEILASAREDLENQFQSMVDSYGPLMKFLDAAGVPLPAGMRIARDLQLQSALRRQLRNGDTDLEQLAHLVAEARRRGAEALNADVSYAVKGKMERLIRAIAEKPDDLARIQELSRIAALVVPLPLGLNLAEVQEAYWRIHSATRGARANDSKNGHDYWNEFLELGERLSFAPEALRGAPPQANAASPA